MPVCDQKGAQRHRHVPAVDLFDGVGAGDFDPGYMPQLPGKGIKQPVFLEKEIFSV